MGLVETLQNLAQSLTLRLPENYFTGLSFFIYFIIIITYSIFIWYLHKFIAKKDIIAFNITQYNQTKYPRLDKSLNFLLYILQYIIAMPLLVILWFTIFGLFLLLFSKELTAPQILLITAAVVASIRFTSYVLEELSVYIARLFPFTILAVFLTIPDFFSLGQLITRISEVPIFFNNIFTYLFLIVIIEVVLRLLSLIFYMFTKKEI